MAVATYAGRQRPAQPLSVVDARAAFDRARQAMLTAYAAALPHLGAVEAALEEHATASAMRQVRELGP